MRDVVLGLKGKIIAVEGVVGAGKSTLCRELKQYLEQYDELDVVMFPEKINEKHLELYVNDLKKYALGFQIECFRSKLNVMNEALRCKRDGKTIIIDRSLVGDKIFAELMFDQNILSYEEYQVYLEYKKEEKVLPDVYLYLNVSLNESIRRKDVRARKGEDKYTIEYLNGLTNKYNKTMQKLKKREKVIFLDWNNDKILGDEKYNLISSIIKQI